MSETPRYSIGKGELSNGKWQVWVTFNKLEGVCGGGHKDYRTEYPFHLKDLSQEQADQWVQRLDPVLFHVNMELKRMEAGL